MNNFIYIIFILYFTSSILLMIYGINCYVMVYLFLRKLKKFKNFKKEINKNKFTKKNYPFITTQIAIFNEYNVAERVIEAVCNIDYPKNKHEIQILDDSTDETTEIVKNKANKLKKQGFDIIVIHRKNRIGYKAGALENGLKTSKGELIAVFDADFVPKKDYFKKIITYFNNKKVGLVQARWGHLNYSSSILTKSQSIGIDGHFMIEQGARCWNKLFMNFNGTAGVWRKEAIYDAGGWQWDTLTEDMDLSYRMQFNNWITRYDPDIVVPAEIPEDVTAFKNQQFRWAKGSIQTAKKLFPRIIKLDIPLFKKIQAFFHLTHYIIHPLMLILSICALPVINNFNLPVIPHLFPFIAVLLLLATMSSTTLYSVSQKIAYPDIWLKKLIILPALVIVGVGIAINNSKAVFEAIIGIESGFVRTPKKGNLEKKIYKTSFPFIGFLEIMLGLYCLLSLLTYINKGQYIIGPFLAIYSLGFLYIGTLTIFQASKKFIVKFS